MLMNQLQLVLLVIAAFILLALYLWGKWQERRVLRQFQESLQAGVSDALLHAPSAEPKFHQAQFDPANFNQVLQAELHSQRREPTFADAVQAEPALSEVSPAPAMYVQDAAPSDPLPAQAPPPTEDVPEGKEWIEDTLADCVIELRCVHAVDGVGVFDAAAPLGQAQLPLPIHLVVWDGRAERWVRPDRFGFYSEVLIAVQLAHRRAQLGELDVARFLSAVEQVALRLEADFDAPEAAHIQKQAAQLAQTCARFDVQVGLTLQPAAGPWEMAPMAQALHACGLVRSADDPLRWLCIDGQERVLFSLLASSPSLPLVDRLAIELDVPTAPMEHEPLSQMFNVAQQLTVSLQAHLVDDNGRAIDANALAAISNALHSLVGDMRALGIEPGSARAMRLYGPLN